MKYQITSILLIMCCFQLNAQLSFGFKASTAGTAITYKNGLTIMTNMFKDKPAEIFDYNSGFSIAALIEMEFSKYVALRIEPGILQTNAFLDHGLVRCGFPDYSNKIFVEVPVKLKLRLPILNNKIGLYTSIGLNPSAQTHTLFKKTEHRDRELIKSDNILTQNLSFKKLGGLGIDFNIKQHQLFIESEIHTKVITGDLLNVNNSKNIHVAVGYLYKLKS